MMDAAAKGKELEVKTEKLRQDREAARGDNFQWVFDVVSQTVPNVLDESGRLTAEGKSAMTQMMETFDEAIEENHLARYDQLKEDLVASLAPGLGGLALTQTDQLGAEVAGEMNLPPSNYEAVSADGFAPGG